MLEIADDYVHPILNKTIRQLDNECDDIFLKNNLFGFLIKVP